MTARRLYTTSHHRTRAARSAKPTTQSLPHHSPMKLALECQPTHARLRIARCQVHRCLLRSLNVYKVRCDPTGGNNHSRYSAIALHGATQFLQDDDKGGRERARVGVQAVLPANRAEHGHRDNARHVCRSRGHLTPHCKERVSPCNGLVRTSGDHVGWCHCDVVLARRLQCAASRCYQTGAIR